MPRPRQNAQVLYEAPPTSLAQWQLTVVDHLRRLRTPPAWHADAACLGAGVEVFFTEHRTAQAKRFCEVCPVIEQCRVAAGDHSASGVWAGVAQHSNRVPLPGLTPHRPRRRAVPA